MLLNKYNGLRRLTPMMEEPDGGTGGSGGTPPAQNPQPAPATVDYDKIQKMLEGTLAAKEDTALKAYFKQQGLSPEEMSQAISAFKEQQAKNTPDVNAMQQQVTDAQKATQCAQIERDAYQLSGELGIDLKTMPYVLKMADLSSVIGEDGGVDQEKLKESLNKVLEDVPQLKPQPEANQSGFRQIGVGQQAQQQTQTQQKPSVATKRWNRWNS